MWILSAAYVSADILNILYAKLTKLLPWLKKKNHKLAKWDKWPVACVGGL